MSNTVYLAKNILKERNESLLKLIGGYTPVANSEEETILNNIKSLLPTDESQDFIYSFDETSDDETQVIIDFLKNINACDSDKCKLNIIELLDVELDLQEDVIEEVKEAVVVPPPEETVDVTVELQEGELIPIEELLDVTVELQEAPTEEQKEESLDVIVELTEEEKKLPTEETLDVTVELQEEEKKLPTEEKVGIAVELQEEKVLIPSYPNTDIDSERFNTFVRSISDIDIKEDDQIQTKFTDLINNVLKTNQNMKEYKYTGGTNGENEYKFDSQSTPLEVTNKTPVITSFYDAVYIEYIKGNDTIYRSHNIDEYKSYYTYYKQLYNRFKYIITKPQDDENNITDITDIQKVKNDIIVTFSEIIKLYLKQSFIRDIVSLPISNFKDLLTQYVFILDSNNYVSSRILYYIIDILFVDITDLIKHIKQYIYETQTNDGVKISKLNEIIENYKKYGLGDLEIDVSEKTIISIMDLINILNQFKKSNIKDTNPDIKAKFNTNKNNFEDIVLSFICRKSYFMYILQHIIVAYILNKKDDEYLISQKISFLSITTNPTTLRRRVNKTREDVLSNNVLTYVKFRCNKDQTGGHFWNERFNISVNVEEVNKIEQSDRMIVKYSNFPFAFYKNNDNVSGAVYTENKEKYVTEYLSKFKDSFPKDNDIRTYLEKYIQKLQASDSVEKSYTDKYYFGEFTSIFRYDLNNSEIATRMNTIQDKVINGIPALIIGYGASGAGKTTSLIYNNKEDDEAKKNGILIHLANEIIEKTQTTDTDKITGITVNIYEFYDNGFNEKDTEDKTDNTKVREYKKTYGSLEYEYKKVGETARLLLNKDTSIVENTHSKRVENLIYDEMKNTDKYNLELIGYENDKKNPLFIRTIKYNSSSLYRETINKIRGKIRGDDFKSYNYFIVGNGLYKIDKSITSQTKTKYAIYLLGKNDWELIKETGTEIPALTIDSLTFRGDNTNEADYDNFLSQLDGIGIFTKGQPSIGGGENDDEELSFKTQKNKYLKLSCKGSDSKPLYSFYLVEGDTPEKTVTYTRFYAGSPIATYIIHAIDNDRFVKATENNPNSSRSHSLIFLDFVTKRSVPYGKLIVGDFAGVENKFTCENETTLNKLLKVRRDFGDKTTPFYKDPQLGYLTANIKDSNKNPDNCDFNIVVNDDNDENTKLDVSRFMPNDATDKIITNDGRELFVPLTSEDSRNIFEENIKDRVKGDTFEMNKKEVEQICKEIFTYKVKSDSGDTNPVESYKSTLYGKDNVYHTVYSTILKKLYTHITNKKDDAPPHKIDFTVTTMNSYDDIIKKLINAKQQYNSNKSSGLTLDSIENTITNIEGSISYDDLKNIYDKNNVGTDYKNADNKISSNLQKQLIEQVNYIGSTNNENRFIYLTVTRDGIINSKLKEMILKLNTIDLKGIPFPTRKKIPEPIKTNIDSIDALVKQLIKGKYIYDDLINLQNMYVRIVNYLSDNKSTGRGVVDDSNVLTSFRNFRGDTTEKADEKAKEDLKDFFNNSIYNYKTGGGDPLGDKYKKNIESILTKLNKQIDKFKTIGDVIKKTISKYKYIYVPNNNELYMINDNFYEYDSKQSGVPESFKPVLEAFKYALDNPPLYQKYYLNFTKYITTPNVTKNIDELFTIDTRNKITDDAFLSDVAEYKLNNQRILENMFDFFIAKLRQNDCKTKYISGVCDVRRNEGFMINTSLSTVRKTFSVLLQERTKSNILINPPHFEDCDDLYKNKNGELFKFSNSQDGIVGTIFDTIKIKEKIDTDKLVLSVFCVLNASRDANNPPPVPYIDLSELRKKYKDAYYLREKRITTNDKKYDDKITDLVKYALYMCYFINVLSKDLNRDFILSNNYFDYTANLQRSQPVTNMTITKYLQDVLIDFEKFKQPYEDIYNAIDELINYIDNINQVSAIGTLEFVDRLSKLNTVDTLCRVDSTQPDTYTNYNEIQMNYLSNKEKDNYYKTKPDNPTSGGGSPRRCSLEYLPKKASRFHTSFRRRSLRKLK